jgi:acyl phosphate:glycerol-3-phosphate acyltransferase
MKSLALAPYRSRMPGSPHRQHRQGPSSAVHPHLLNSLVVPLAILAIAVAAYLLGSIPVGYLLYRIFRRQDIRSLGSGNIGATNVLRAGGAGLGIATFVLDVLKGSSAIWLGGLLGALLIPAVPLRTAQAIAALFAVIGHMFTCWLHFRGGKGVATGFGVFLVASFWAALAAIGVFIVVLLLTRYVSLGSILGAASFPVFASFLVTGPRPPVFIAVQWTVALLIIIKHHQNIRRLFAGTETRIGAHKLA